MNARDAILSRVQNACGRESANEVNAPNKDVDAFRSSLPIDIQQRLTNPVTRTQPKLKGELVEELIRRMESVQMTVTRLQSSADVPAAVDWFQTENQLQGPVKLSPALEHLDWPIGTQAGAAEPQDQTSVTTVLAAVAETGSVALRTNNDSPATLNFLPENHVVVVYESQVVKHLEDVGELMRNNGDVPRAINLVTGPSRTGDIEQTIELGAHGPKRVHVLLISGDVEHTS